MGGGVVRQFQLRFFWDRYQGGHSSSSVLPTSFFSFFLSFCLFFQFSSAYVSLSPLVSCQLFLISFRRAVRIGLGLLESSRHRVGLVGQVFQLLFSSWGIFSPSLSSTCLFLFCFSFRFSPSVSSASSSPYIYLSIIVQPQSSIKGSSQSICNVFGGVDYAVGDFNENKYWFSGYYNLLRRNIIIWL